MKEIIDQSRKTPKNSSNPDFNEVVSVIDYLTDEKEAGSRKGNELLRFLRDRAIVLLLADTGIDIEIICSLICQNVDFRKSVVSYDSGEEEKVISISPRTSQAIKTYLDERSLAFPSFGKPKTSPLFARHDKGTGKKVQSLTTATIRNIVKERAKETFKVEGSQLKISPIWFRHYYEKNITRSLHTLLHPKIIERCLRLYEDGHYQSAVFDAMKVIEIEVRNKLKSSEKLYGVDLIGFAFGGDNPRMLLRSEKKEHDAARGLFMGAVTLMRNPLGHKFLDETDQIKALECLSFASLLMRMLDDATIVDISSP